MARGRLGGNRGTQDEMLQISVQPLFGVEMFRFQVNRDSLLLIDRMNKCYVHESIVQLKESYPIGFDFYTLQALFTNRIFVAGKSKPTVADYRNFHYSQSSDLFHDLKAKDPASNIDYSFSVNGKDKIAFSNIAYLQREYVVQWSYTDFIQNKNQFFPTTMHVAAQGTQRNLNIGLSFSDIVVDEPLSISMSVPANYHRVPIQEVLDVIVKL